jgi:methionyl-tRNA formyltransferase
MITIENHKSDQGLWNFAIATADRYLGVFDAFVNAGWNPLKLFTVPLKNELGNQQAVISYAEQHAAAIQISRMNAHDLAELREQGCQALIVASYDWIICDWRPFLKYAVNFHCSPLPDGRGPFPFVRAILEGREFWGITCHQLSPEIDKGDILCSENFPLRSDECLESLDLKTQMAAKRLATKVANNFIELWEQATPQESGSYWQKLKIEEQIIDFQKPVESILRHVRAFGAIGSLAKINNTWIHVKRAIGWVERHNHMPGHVVHVFNRSIVIAASDGYIGLIEINLEPPHVAAERISHLE